MHKTTRYDTAIKVEYWVNRYRTATTEILCTMQDIRDYYMSGDDGLIPEFVESCPDHRLIRMAQLAGRPFVDFIDARYERRFEGGCDVAKDDAVMEETAYSEAAMEEAQDVTRESPYL